MVSDEPRVWTYKGSQSLKHSKRKVSCCLALGLGLDLSSIGTTLKGFGLEKASSHEITEISLPTSSSVFKEADVTFVR